MINHPKGQEHQIVEIKMFHSDFTNLGELNNELNILVSTIYLMLFSFWRTEHALMLCDHLDISMVVS